MTYKEARVYLDNMSKYGSVLGLDTIRELLHELGDPQKDLKFIHIAGTNGKGSVLAYTSSILSQAGYKTGRYVSPTVVSYLERIQIDGTWISEEAFARCTHKIQEAIARMETAGKRSPTVFEAETAIAFLYFKEEHCDLVVLECGLGGDQDATNIIENTLCAVFTSISLDHLGILGNTIEEIAQTKSGIIKSGCRVVSAPQKPEVLQILEQRANSLHCPFYTAERNKRTILNESYSGQTFSYKKREHIFCPLAGKYQADNAITALEVIDALIELGYNITENDIDTGFSQTSWPGRFTCLGEHPLFFIDGAHNEDAAKRLKESIDTYFPGKHLIYIMGVFHDKEYQKLAAIMAPSAKSVHTVDLPNAERTLSAGDLAEVMRTYCSPDIPVSCERSIKDAVKNALADAKAMDPSDGDNIILAFGSLSYLGQVREEYHQLTQQIIEKKMIEGKKL